MNLIWWEDMVQEGERKTLHFLTQVPPLTLDPAESFDIVTRNVVSNLYEGLVTQEPFTLEPQPGIAESWEIIEPGESYLFYLRTNARFSDGEPILADDVIFSIHRIGQFQGSRLVATQGIHPRTVRLDVFPPIHGILDYLATPPFSIVARSMVENVGFTPEHLISSGPFRLKRRDETHISHPSIKLLERNPYYWDRETIKIDQVAYIPIMDADERLRIFQTRFTSAGKRLHYFLNHGPVMRYEELKHNPELQPSPVHATIVLTPNFNVKPLADKRVRRALSLAISRERMLNILPHVHVADALVPREMRYYPEPRSLLQNNESEARHLMAEAGYPEGSHFPELTLTLFDHDYQERMIQYVVDDLKRVLGITVKCRRMPWSEYLLRLESKDYELLYETWHADVPDPGAFLIPLSTDHPFNTPGYSNPEFDQLMLLSLDEMQDQQRTEYYLKAEKLLIEDMAVIPLLYDSHFVMIDEGVRGARLNKAAVLPLKNIELIV